MAKILVIRFSSIGDIVLATPVLRCIKDQLPGAELHFLTKSSFKQVTIANPYIDKFFYFDKELGPLTDALRAEQYDHVIDLHNNIRSKRIRKALKRPTEVIDKLSFQKVLLTKLNINLMPGRHITQRSLDTVKALGVRNDGKGLDYFVPEEENVPLDQIPTSHHAGYIAIVIGASYATKRMPVHKFQELCYKLEHPVILLGGKEDRDSGELIASVDPVKIYNACGKFSLNESADLIRQSKLVVSHDTGMQDIG
jgi:ADP-heptose:LPS heptosyltransferase